MELSIVTTLYNSASHLREFHRRAVLAAASVTADFEVIYVNDGSPDDSLEIILEEHAKDPRVKVVDLSRNFGQHKAVMTGLGFSSGKLVFLLDSDLEEAPEILKGMLEHLEKTKADAVYGLQQDRKGGIVRGMLGGLFYALFSKITAYDIPRNSTMARLLTRRYVNALLEYRDKELYFDGVCAITGFHQVPYPVDKTWKKRTDYSLAKRVSMAVTAITSFSNKPLIFIFYLGCFVFGTAFVAASYLFSRQFLYGIYLEGWASLTISIWMIGGLMLLCLGILGIYLSRLFVEVKDRPLTTVRAVYDRSGKTNEKI
ncbi:MAG TPA: glycosyltransferase family 2 protein [Candidatus Omnitrophota bacterium]|nr:glycosyltransferase family 2 protein [Candidatus Omnitrophota bacterium]HPS36564.1 glycosyltransferase family 2 protein [Candidatus Omnitrophota bacterium]